MTKIQAQDIAHYFLQHDTNNDDSDGISHLKIQKLVYYAYGFYYAIFGQPLFEETFEARHHGPVLASLAEVYQGCGRNPISMPEHSDTTMVSQILSHEQQRFLNSIYHEYSQYSAWKLSAMTHEETPWLNGVQSGVIADTDIVTYFSDIVHRNEHAALLESCPDIYDRIAEVESDDFVGVPFEDVMEELGISV